MSLLPVNTFPGVIFLEARVLGQPAAAIVGQIGVSVDATDASVAVFSRASSVLLVAGVGSYCAYRICTKYLGRRFVWELLDTTRYDRIATADRRLLYASELPILIDEEVDDQPKVVEEEEGDRQSEVGGGQLSVPSSSRSINDNVLTRFSRIRSSSRGKGLFGIRAGSGREGVVRRSSVKSGEWHNSRPASSCSDRSASLRIVFESNDEQWDDEFAEKNPMPGFHISPNYNRNLQETASVGDLNSVFDDVLSVTSGLEKQELDENLNDEQKDEEAADLMRIKCMTDSKYMYQSVIMAGSEIGSEAGSILGGSPGSIRSFLSNALSLRKKAFHPKKEMSPPKGLWQLTQEDTQASTSIEIPPDPTKTPEMTDSGLTRSSYSKKSQNRSSMFDSAIGPDILSSDEGSVHLDSENKRRLNSLQENDSSSIAPSEMSLEWFDDGLRCQELIQGNCASGSRAQSPSKVDENKRMTVEGLDWDLEEKSQKSENASLASDYSSSQPMTISVLHRPSESRDLMVLACELFQPYSKHFKTIQRLYHRKRLKRVGLLKPGEGSENILALVISSALYHRCDLLRDVNWQVLEKRFNDMLKECDFLRKWPKRNENTMRSQLKELWNLAKDPSSKQINCEHVRGLQLLLVLEAKRVYDEKLAGLCGGLDWFTVDSPATVLQYLHSGSVIPDSLLFSLLVRCCKFSVEVIDVQQKTGGLAGNNNNSSVLYSKSSRGLEATATLSFLHHSNVTVPLFYVPDE